MILGKCLYKIMNKLNSIGPGPSGPGPVGGPGSSGAGGGVGGVSGPSGPGVGGPGAGGGPGDIRRNGFFPPIVANAQAPQPQPLSSLEQSANENIALQERQLAEIERITAPFREAATGTALPSLSALALGGDVDFQPSQLFERQLDRGRTGVLRGQAAGGAGVKSSRTFERLSDLVSGLAAEDFGRFEAGNLSLLNQGVTATGQLGQAGSQLTGNVGAIFSNLGQGLNVQGQQRGQAERARAQTLSGGIQGLGSLAASFF